MKVYLTYLSVLVERSTMMSKRLYGLFERQDGRWVRLMPTLEYTKALAVRVFQSELLAPAIGGSRFEVKGERRLMAVKKEVDG
jgi:hypothetical protein